MTEETLTPEETAALQEMESDTGEGIETPEPVADTSGDDTVAASDEGKEEGKEPEFKSSRTDDKPPEGYVPHQAMHAERVKRQELERRLAEIEASMKPKEQDQAPQYVDPLEDPEGFRKYNEYQIGQIKQQTEAQQRQAQEHHQRQQVFADVQQSEAEFAAKAPDYQNAVDHLYQTRMRELQGMGYGEQEVKAQIARDTMTLYQAAKQVGMNPAEFAYMRAQSLGYQKAAPAQPAPADSGEAGKMQALSRAQEATSGLGTTGAPQDGGLTVAQLAKMSEEELAKIPDEDFKRVMGG